MGTYTFEKPELTFSYVNHLIHIFDMYGLTLQAVPLHFFTKYISKHILGNELLSLLASLKLKYSLFAMKHPLESAVKINLDELVITAQEQKSEKILSENGRNNDEEAQQLVQVYSRS